MSPTWSTRPTTRCGARSTSLWVHRNLFWQLSRDGNLHGSGMSHAMTAFQKPFFRAPWMAQWSAEERLDGQHQKMDRPTNAMQGPPAEKTGRVSLLSRPPCPPDDPIDQGTELNRTFGIGQCAMGSESDVRPSSGECCSALAREFYKKNKINE